jgi:hypothetical protein
MVDTTRDYLKALCAHTLLLLLLLLHIVAVVAALLCRNVFVSRLL